MASLSAQGGVHSDFLFLPAAGADSVITDNTQKAINQLADNHCIYSDFLFIRPHRTLTAAVAINVGR